MNNKDALNVLMNNYKSGKLERLVHEYGADEVVVQYSGTLALWNLVLGSSTYGGYQRLKCVSSTAYTRL